MRRSAVVLLATTLSGAVLVGCSPVDGSVACELPAAGDTASLVSSEAFPDAGLPAVTFPTPLVAGSSGSAVIEQGDGRTVSEGSYFTVSYIGFLGDSYDEADIVMGAGIDGTAQSAFTYDVDTLQPALLEGLACATEGSRIAVTGPVSELVGEAAAAQLGADETLVLVFEIEKVYPPKADGADQWLTASGLPAVVTAPDGTPGITIPKTEQPTELSITTLKKGTGSVVDDDDAVAVYYSGWLWERGSGGTTVQFDSNWSTRVPLTVSLEQGTAIPGFLQALEGQTVGSQVLAVIPADLGYGEAGTGSIPGGATLVFVIDILAVED